MKKKYTWHVLSFLIPFLAVVGISIGNGVYPFGDRCLLHVDMYHQYCPFFTEFMDKLKHGGSLMYTWKQGLGSDFVALYAYYLASPLNFLLVLCPKRHVIEFMTLLTWIKISGSGLAFFTFLTEHFKLSYGKNRNPQIYLGLAFSTAYALSGFVAAYSWDIMWMDVIMLAPLAILGLERVLLGKGASMYYLSLALAIWCNYYISIMLCIFLVMYYVAFLLIHGELSWKSRRVGTLRFAAYSLLAGATSGVLLLPEIAILQYAGSSTDRFPEKMEWYFNLLQELGRGCAIASVYTGQDNWPNLYAGSFTLLLVTAFFMNRRIGLSKKLLGGAGVAFFLVSFANNRLDFIWHGFHFPNSLPARQSYLYIFLLLLMGFATIMEWRGIRLWQVAATGLLWIGILVAGGITTQEEVTEWYAYLFTGLFLLCYVLLFLLRRYGLIQNRRKIVLLAAGIMVCEVIVNFAVTGFYTTSRTEYRKKADAYQKLLEYAKEQEQGNFYRVEDPQRMTKNDNTLYGYPSATVFSSLMNLEVGHFYQALYMEGGKNFYCYNGATPLTSALLSVKYLLYDTALEENAFRRLVCERDGQYLYENTLCLPLGFFIGESVARNWPKDSGYSSRVDNLNQLGHLLGATEDMLIACTSSIPQDKEPGCTTLTMPEEGIYYVAYKSCEADTLQMETTTGRTRKFSKTTHRYLMELGLCKAGEAVSITNRKEEAVEFVVYKLKEAAVWEAYETLAEQPFRLKEYSDTDIQGEIQVAQAGRLVLSVPCEKGWTLYVDGEKTQMEPLADALIGVHLKEGTHSITLRYETPNLRIGGLCSLVGILGFAILQIIERRGKTKANGAVD